MKEPAIVMSPVDVTVRPVLIFSPAESIVTPFVAAIDFTSTSPEAMVIPLIVSIDDLFVIIPIE